MLLYLVVPQDEHTHYYDASKYIAEEEACVHYQEEISLAHAMLDHAPSAIHEKGGPLTEEISGR